MCERGRSVPDRSYCHWVWELHDECSWSLFSERSKLLGKTKDGVETVMVGVKKDESFKEVMCDKINVFVSIWSSDRLRIS
jgi:hypothetical protein